MEILAVFVARHGFGPTGGLEKMPIGKCCAILKESSHEIDFRATEFRKMIIGK